MKSAVQLFLDERAEQVKLGWTPKHDDTHKDGELADAASCFAAVDVATVRGNGFELSMERTLRWPWELSYWKERETTSIDQRIHELAKAGALLVAEIERLQRLKVRRRLKTQKALDRLK